MSNKHLQNDVKNALDSANFNLTVEQETIYLAYLEDIGRWKKELQRIWDKIIILDKEMKFTMEKNDPAITRFFCAIFRKEPPKLTRMKKIQEEYSELEQQYKNIYDYPPNIDRYQMAMLGKMFKPYCKGEKNE